MDTLPPAFSTVRHLAIDVQGRTCDPRREQGTKEGEKIARAIQKTVSGLHEQEIPTVFVCDYRKQYTGEFNARVADLYLVSPDRAKGDTLTRKTSDSAFEGTDLHDRLQQEGVSELVVTGFNAGYCLLKTVTDAVGLGYNVSVLTDCIGQSSYGNRTHDADAARRADTLSALEQAGATLTTSKSYLAAHHVPANDSTLVPEPL